MALLAEELVEEWLNRQGYFTIRGIKLGVQEMDILAIRHDAESVDCRHFEVQASMRPVSYISKMPKSEQKKGKARNSVKRSPEELQQGVAEWVETKFQRPDKRILMQSLCPSNWTSELVLNNVKSDEEVELIAAHGIKIHRLNDVLRSLSNDQFLIKSASGADFVDLVQMGERAD